MLSSPDSIFAERQPELPGLRVLFDVDALSSAAQHHGVRLPAACEPSYIRFKPGTRCLVGYSPAGQRGVAKFYASAFAPQSEKLIKARERKVCDTEFGPGRIVFDESAVELCLFPNDDHLKALIYLADPRRRDSELAHVVPGHAAGKPSSLTILAYKPERRCVMRYANERGVTALIKAYEKSGFEDAKMRASYFSAHCSMPAVQSVLGTYQKRGLIAMKWLSGRLLADEIVTSSPDLSFMWSAGAMLARIHSLPPRSLPAWSADVALQRSMETAAVLDVLMPDAAAKARDLAHEIGRELAAINAPSVVCHGDFHTRQILIGEDRLFMLDFDEALIAPPSYDLGYFISRLQMKAARGEITEAVASQSAAALVDGYESAAGRVSPRDAAVFTALALLSMAHDPFRRHLPDWPGEIMLVLEQAEQQLGAGVR